jgi:cytochrome c biogenesis protein ResB
VGALVTSFGGFTTQAPGYAGDVIDKNVEKLENMPFEVRVDSFRIQYYPLQPGQLVLVDDQWIGRLIEKDSEHSWAVERWTSEHTSERVSMEAQYIRNNWDFERDRGNIQRYVSYVTVMENGQEVEKSEVAVNSPLRRAGYRFYQSSFDRSDPRITARFDSVTIHASDSAAGISHTLNLTPGQSVQIPGDTLTVTAGTLLPNFKLGQNFKAYSEGVDFVNPALQLTFRGPNGFEKAQWTFLKFPSHEAGPGKYTYRITDLKGQNASLEMATIFEVKKTFGTEVLWLGFIAGTLGLILSFYLYHRVLYVEWPNEQRKTTRLIGLTRKTSHLYARDLDRLIEGQSGSGEISDAADRVHRPASLRK